MPARINTNDEAAQTYRKTSGGLEKRNIDQRGNGKLPRRIIQRAPDEALRRPPQAKASGPLLFSESRRSTNRYRRDDASSVHFPVSMPSLVEGNFDRIWDEESMGTHVLSRDVVFGSMCDDSVLTDPVSIEPGQHASVQNADDETLATDCPYMTSVDLADCEKDLPAADHSMTRGGLEEGVNLEIASSENVPVPTDRNKRHLSERSQRLLPLIGLMIFVLGTAFGILLAVLAQK